MAENQFSSVTANRAVTAPAKKPWLSGTVPEDDKDEEKPEEDFNALILKARSSSEALRAVVGQMQPAIDKALLNWAGGKASPVLRQRARIMAAQAIKTFDPSRGAKLQTHIMNQLQSLQRESSTIAQPLPMPERFRRDQGALVNAQNELAEVLGREPSDEELADAAGLSVKRVTKIKRLMYSRLPMSALEADEDAETDAPEIEAQEDDPYQVWVDAVYHDLPERDKLILQYRTGYRGAPVLSNIQIAGRVGLSPAAVSQRAAQIQKRLDAFNG